MWTVALFSTAILMSPSIPALKVASEAEGYNACIYNCVAVCGSTYTDYYKCDRLRQNCKRNCILKFPTQFKGCNKGWQPTAQGCKCIKPLLANGICPR